MKATVRKFLALILAMLMALSLAACGEKNEEEKDSGKEHGATPVVKDPGDDPGQYLAMANENTLLELRDRYSGSPLAAIADTLSEKGKVTVSGGIDMGYDGALDLRDLTLAYDLDKKEFLVTMDAEGQGMVLKGGVCLSPDFVGVSLPAFLGDDTYYGIEPRNLRRQLENSPLMEASGSSVDDIPELEQLDELLDLLWDADFIDYDKLLSEYRKISEDYIEGLDVSYEEESFDVDGKRTDGYVFTANVTSEDLVDMTEKIYDLILDMPIWDTLSEIGRISDGEYEIDMNELRDIMDESLAEIRKVDYEQEIVYYVADQKVIRAETRFDLADWTNGSDSSVMIANIDYFDDGKISLTVSGIGEDSPMPTELLTFTSSVESSRGSYTHELTITVEGETMTVTAGWDGSSLNLDIDIPYETPISLTCGLKTTSRGFEISDFVFDDGDPYDRVELPLTIKYSAGGSVAMPVNTRNLLKMDEEELMELFGDLPALVGGYEDDYYGW